MTPDRGFCVSVCIRKVSDIFLFGNSKKNFGRIFCENGKLYVTLQRLRRGAPRLGITIVLWCNGSTTVFGSVCLGSNPGKTTIEKKETSKPHGRMVSFFFFADGLSRSFIRDYLGGGYTGLSRVTGFCSHRPHPANLFDWYTCMQFLRRLRCNRHQKGH